MNKIILNWAANLDFKLEKNEIKELIKILNFFYPSVNFEDFYNPMNNTYKNPDKIILDAFLVLF